MQVIAAKSHHVRKVTAGFEKPRPTCSRPGESLEKINSSIETPDIQMFEKAVVLNSTRRTGSAV